MSLINSDDVKWGVQTVFTVIILIFAVEGVASILFYQKLKLPGWSVSSAVHLFISSQALNEKFEMEIVATDNPGPASYADKLHTVLDRRKQGATVYPSYLFEPQYHHPSSPYILTNVSEADVIYCDENGFFNSWRTDELGFRNPLGQINQSVDYVLIGDSFAVGACEQEAGTIAGLFRSRGSSVANLSRGGSGPLFQLATLVEYGHLFNSEELVWIIFTGNDLQNLTEEKVTLLGSYLDPSFTQGLYNKRVEVQRELKRFLNTQIKENKYRFDSGLPYPGNKGYGESLDAVSAQKYESQLLLEVADRVHTVAGHQGKELRIVLLHHYRYSAAFKKITSQAIKDFSHKNGVKFLEISTDFLTIHQNFYTQSGPHFDDHGYREIGQIILDWVKTSPLRSATK